MTDIQATPAPWELKGRSWASLVSSLAATSSFPAGWSSAYQAEALSSGGEFIGGFGVIQVISYSESPVVDLCPGRWKYSDGTKAFRITQIYVSTKESVMNGRKNWNIPKHIAGFDITTRSDGVTDISVGLPGASSPFFKASFKPITILSSLAIPTSTTLLKNFFALMQPPLPAGEESEEVATDQWAALTPVLKGSTSLRTLVPGLNGKVGDGIGFPAVVPWSIGFAMENLKMDFGVPTMHDAIKFKTS
ncbi:hypothetical protein B0H19DRAFT_1205969 [Mycena capillaripes]|nr:hypothetical protein B0H19DRAFT_1205969 [Mycena capillaripes]